MKNKKDHLYKELPKKCDPKDFFGQVKRTVNGKPVSKKDIKLIVDAIKTNLLIEDEDHLFDIGCGNGALASLFFDDIKKLCRTRLFRIPHKDCEGKLRKTKL